MIWTPIDGGWQCGKWKIFRLHKGGYELCLHDVAVGEHARIEQATAAAQVTQADEDHA